MNYLIDNLNGKVPQFMLPKVVLWKHILTIFFVVTFFVIFLYKLFTIQILNSNEYKLKAQSNYVSNKYILPDRGIIYSKNSTPLVENIPAFKVVIDLNKFDRFKTYKNIYELIPQNIVSVLLENNILISNDQINQINSDLKLGKEFFELKIFYDQKEYSSLVSKFKDFDKNFGIKIVEGSVRNYLYKDSFSHLLGFVNNVNEDSIKNDKWYTPDSKKGVEGIEAYYEKYLRGDKGEKELIYNSKYSVYSSSNIIEPKNGDSIVTTIDIDLQKVAYLSLKKQVEKVKATGGGVVVQNPNTGEILALVSYPSYDNNLFSKGILAKDYNKLLNDLSKPMLNRAISTAFPPGSTFKVVTALAGLNEGSITPSTTIVDRGVININGFSYKTWKSGGHGVINVIDALKESSDIFFYVLGGGHADYPQVKAIGPWKLYKWSKLFGFGSYLGVDTVGEISGFVADPNWKKQTYNEDWYIGNTYHFAIGQGFVTSTPLQINTMINAIANGGNILKPYLVSKIVKSSGEEVKKFEPSVITTLNVSSESLSVIKEGLVKAVSPGGTAYPLFNYKVSVAGKTGTAEFGPQKKDGTYPTHAWFTAFAPSDNPKISVTVFLENGGGGSDNSAPIAKDIFDEFFK